jgi:hypothetical protein
MQATDHKALLTDHVVHCDSVGALPVVAIRRMLEQDSFACVRGLIRPEEVTRVKEAWRRRFDPANDRDPDPKRPDLFRRNFQYVIHRTHRQIAAGRPQLLRAFYNPLWDDDLFGFHALVAIMARLRNRLMDLPAGFAVAQPERGVWTASRIYQYPRGGGFMIPHRDETFSSFPSELGVYGYYQMVLVMSRKGIDFHEGGGYFVNRGKRVFFEQEYELGDMVLYDDRVPHGVQEIDPKAPLDLQSPLGRLAGFANLYRVL